MQKDVEEAARQVALLPPNPSTTQKQIAGASQESADVAQSGIKASNSYARAPLKLSVSFITINQSLVLTYLFQA